LKVGPDFGPPWILHVLRSHLTSLWEVSSCLLKATDSIGLLVFFMRVGGTRGCCTLLKAGDLVYVVRTFLGME